MYYYGGKYRLAPHITPVIQEEEFVTYWEPFCGACSVMERVKAPHRLATDLHLDLIIMWQALQSGWVPPTEMSREEYYSLKGSEPSALRAFAGFGCSHSGRWFGGWARNASGRNYAKNAHNSLLRKIRSLGDVEFRCADYRDVDVRALKKPLMIYCDPPYAASTNNYASGKFDVRAFWSWVRKVSAPGVSVLVSEYEAPSDFSPVWTKDVKTDLRGSDGRRCNRTEYLFALTT